jgi:hypothetical protein
MTPRITGNGVAWVLPRVAVADVGAPGVVIGVLLTTLLALPCPAAFTAETRKSYDEPFVSPVTVLDVAVETPSENTDHTVGSLDNLYSIT